MGLGSFFKKLFGGANEESAPETRYAEPSPDAVKDASDFVVPQPELVPDQTMPIVEKTSAFAHDSDEDATGIQRDFTDDENRIEEAAD